MDEWQKVKTLIRLPYSTASDLGLDSLRSTKFNDDKRIYQVNIFLISSQKHMLWVLIISASARHF